ncbi:MAG: glycosyltransferase family 4 protein [Nitrososphaerota archaeon]
MTRIIFYNPQGFEPWDWRNPDILGIGGSETCQIEMARRLSRMGHRVTSYAPVPGPSEDCGVDWRHFSEADFTEPGLWIIFRSPESADRFDPGPDRVFWHVCQDVHYFERVNGRVCPSFTEARASKFSRIIALCPTHRDFLAKNYPFLESRLCISSNGIKTDLIEKLDTQTRNPYKIVWASSPDRGLEALLHIFKRAREYEPRLELVVCYGFDNWDKVIAKNPGGIQDRMKRRILSLFCPGVTFLGRLPQHELWKQFLSAGIWCYPTTFEETSCIACMEAQALGAIPITNNYWAVGHNVKYGFFISGDPLNDPLTRARYVGRVVSLARDPDLQSKIRERMMSWARHFFNWDLIAQTWSYWSVIDTRVHSSLSVSYR